MSGEQAKTIPFEPVLIFSKVLEDFILVLPGTVEEAAAFEIKCWPDSVYRGFTLADLAVFFKEAPESKG